jgi:hypothetical protein
MAWCGVRATVPVPVPVVPHGMAVISISVNSRSILSHRRVGWHGTVGAGCAAAVLLRRGGVQLTVQRCEE